MMLKVTATALAALLCLCASRPAGADGQAGAPGGPVVIGDIDDLSGVYSDIQGQGGIEAIHMAIADAGGTVLGKKIVVLSADHQNKPDIGASKFREWSDQNGLNMLLGGANTGVSIAMAKVAAAKKVPFIAIGAGGSSLTGADCTAYSIHYAYDTTALANGTASVIVKQGGKSWYFVTADYAFGTQLQEAAVRVVTANGGKVLGAVRAPLGTTDYSSFLLQAQASGAQVLGLANAGTDFSNSLKGAYEFGLTKSMTPAALLAYISDIHSLTLQTAQGLYLTTPWYWDLNEETREFSKRYTAKMHKPPTAGQAAYYSATLEYLKAVKAVNSTDPDLIMAEMKKAKINDVFTKNGYVRPDGLMVHTMYVMQVKSPAESKYPWDYYKVIKVMPGEDAYGQQSDPACRLARK